MSSTMMDVPLTLDWIADRAERYMGSVEVVSRRPDKSISRSSYAQVIASSRRLARALVAAGIKKGDRVATLMWNHAEHLEVYFGIPLSGAMTRMRRRGPSTVPAAYWTSSSGQRGRKEAASDERRL